MIKMPLIKPFIKPKILIALGSFGALIFSGFLLANLLTSDTGTLVLGKNTTDGVLNLDVPETVQSNKPFNVNVEVDSRGNTINATGVNLTFDPDVVEILDMDTRASYCQFYPEKRFDNRLGTVSLACGSPHPGFNGKSTLIKLQLRAKRTGVTTLYVSSTSQILLSDGKGTNILTTYPTATVKIVNSL